MKITVYLGSRFGNDPIYNEMVVKLGHWLVSQNHHLVWYGSRWFDGLSC